MSLYELLDLTASNSAKIDNLWNFFIWIHLAVLGALLLIPRRVTLVERFIVLLAYGAFAYVNRNALVDTYAYQDVLLAEVARFKLAADAAGSGILDYLGNFHLRERISVVRLRASRRGRHRRHGHSLRQSLPAAAPPSRNRSRARLKAGATRLNSYSAAHDACA